MMKIKRIEMHNIRSYTGGAIEIPEGTMLLEGDIGSGKSTILMAIEFALFGGGDIDYSSLLRIGEDSGYVELAIEVDGKDYTLHRELKRNAKSGKIEQKTCYILSSAGKTLYSATEMKTAVLKLLKFKEPKNARASSVVYRYSVYTPQEEMKGIILQSSPEERLTTMRKILDLEKYSTAKSNVQIIRNKLSIKMETQKEKLKEEAGILNRKQEDKAKLDSYSKDVEKYKDDEIKLKKETERIDLEYRKALKEHDEYNIKITELGSHRTVFDKLKGDKESKERKIEQLQKDAEELRKKANNITIPDIKEKANEVDDEIERINKELKDLNKEKGGIDKDIKNYEELTANGKCPVCGREVHHEEFRPKLDEFNRKANVISKKIEKLDLELKYLNKVRKDVNYAEKMKNDKDSYIRQANNTEERIKEAKGDLDQIKENMEEEDKKIKELSSAEEEIKKATDKLNIADGKRKSINDKMNEVTGKLREAEARLDETKKRVEEYEKKIEEIKKAKSLVDRYSNLISFLQDVFNPALSNAEQSVMVSTNEKMNELISSWFAKLVPDPAKEISIDDSFTPIIRENGYDLDVTALSGGEKSAVALSYRLALNTIVNNYAGNVGVLILDEPTDGFSKEQLQKFGDVLRDINSEQIILVSHEAELENVADRVMRVEKNESVSHIY